MSSHNSSKEQSGRDKEPPLALRKWDAARDEVTIRLTHAPDDAEMERLNVAIRAFVGALSSEEQRLSPSEASAGNAGLDDLTPLPPDIKEIVEGLERTAYNFEASGRSDDYRHAQKLRQAASAILSLAGERARLESELSATIKVAGEWRRDAEASIAERDEARRELEGTYSAYQSASAVRGENLQRALLAEKQLAEAVGVLEPFARTTPVRQSEDARFYGWSPGEITYGDCKRARAFLDQHQSPQSSKEDTDG